MYKIDFRVYYQDTDASGIVYHSNYLKYAERARTEWLIQNGFSEKDLKKRAIGFVVKEAFLDYKSPAFYEDILTVTVQPVDVKNASMDIEQSIYRGTTLLVHIRVKIVVIHPKTLKPLRIPEDIKKVFYEKEQ